MGTFFGTRGRDGAGAGFQMTQEECGRDSSAASLPSSQPVIRNVAGLPARSFALLRQALTDGWLRRACWFLQRG